MEKYGELEAQFAKFVGVNHAVAVNTGTASLHIALAALGVGPGDEVIVPEFTMAACAFAVLYTGATPVFVDCDDTMNIDPDRIEAKISQRTKVIMPVHVYGRACDMTRIMGIANEHGILVVEDCSEAHGATWGGKPVGSFGDIGCFSLYRNKIVHAEEGGIAVTNMEHLALRMQDLKNMAFGSQHNYLHNGVGFNYRMTNGQAALALESLANVRANIIRRATVAGWYDVWFGRRSFPRPPGSVIWQYDFFCGDANQEWITRNIAGARHFFKPMSSQPFVAGEVENLNAYQFSKHGVYLPVREDMDREEVEIICRAIKKETNL